MVSWTPDPSLISSVSVAEFAVVTTATPHGLSTGNTAMILVPEDYGMSIPSILTKVVVTNSTTFTTELNTLSSLPFVAPMSTPYTQAQVIPASGLFYNDTPGSPS